MAKSKKSKKTAIINGKSNKVENSNKAKKIWFYFPLPISFNIVMVMITAFSLPSQNSILSFGNYIDNDPKTFLNMVTLLILLWVLGTVVSIKISPIFYRVNKEMQFMNISNLTFKKLVYASASLLIFLLISSLFVTGFIPVVADNFKDIVPVFMYSIFFSYTFIGVALAFYYKFKDH